MGDGVEKIRKEFLESDVFDFDSVYDQNEEYRYQYIQYLESELCMLMNNVEKLKYSNKSQSEVIKKMTKRIVDNTIIEESDIYIENKKLKNLIRTAAESDNCYDILYKYLGENP